MPHGPGVIIQVTASETLIRAVEECVVVLCEHHIRNSFPLLLRRIDASGVVRAGVQQEDRPRGRRLQRIDEALVVQPNGGRIIVGVVHRLNPHVSKDSLMVRCT